MTRGIIVDIAFQRLSNDGQQFQHVQTYIYKTSMHIYTNNNNNNIQEGRNVLYTAMTIIREDLFALNTKKHV